MGEMADMFLDQVMDMEDARLDYSMGGMAWEEAYDRGIIDDTGATVGSKTTERLKTCRCCGKDGLTWSRVKGKFRLFDGKEMHNCPVHPVSD